MSEPEATQEPTMEEILASIRRIISEDDGRGDESAEAAAEQTEVEEGPTGDEQAHQDQTYQAPIATPEAQAPSPEGPRETSNPDDEHYASITAVFSGRQREQADELEEFGDEYDAETAFEAEGEYEAVTEQVAEPDAAASFASQGQTEPEAHVESQYRSEEPSAEDVEAFFGNDNDDATPEFADADFGKSATVEDQIAAASTQQVSFESAARDIVEEEVLSPDTEDRVASLFGQLNEQESSVGSAPSSTEGTSVEGLVREMLRPMLQTWLDENLPPIVERIVEREIKRVTRNR